jgi:hypothetical protein
MPAYHLNATMLPDGDAPCDLWIVSYPDATPPLGEDGVAIVPS